MLEMNERRVSFAELLRPSEGYQLDFAVGTTYSLDLRALLGLCIPLGLGFEPEALSSANPISLFAALVGLKDKVAIFCDKGNIKADIPSNPRSAGLLMLLEKMIHQVHVNVGNTSDYSSFHPKAWVTKYVSQRGEEPLYRLIVMSRNLTFDTSWDVVVSLDGRTGQPNDCSNHVADFLEFLAEGDESTTTEGDDTRRKGSHTARILGLAKEVRRVEFELDGKTFDSVDFLPLAPSSSAGQGRLVSAWDTHLLTWKFRNLLVVSPFLSDGTGSPLSAFQKRKGSTPGTYMLISREDSLARMDPSLREKYECFAPVSTLADVELDGDGETDASNYSDLHAKLYFAEALSSKRYLYMGSLNASYNGTINNVEALLCLGVRPHHLTFKDFIKPFVGDGGKEKAPFAPFVPGAEPDPEEDDKREFKKLFHSIAKFVTFKSAVVSQDEGGKASIAVEIENSALGNAGARVELLLHPLLAAGKSAVLSCVDGTESLEFNDLLPEQVSGLFILEGKDKEGHEDSCILVCPHDRFDDSCLTLEVRSGILMGNILKHGEGSLAQYIAHAFGLPEAGYSTSQDERAAAKGHASHNLSVPAGLYERLLELAYADRSVFDRASYLMGFLPHEVASEELDALNRMIDAFSKAVR